MNVLQVRQLVAHLSQLNSATLEREMTTSLTLYELKLFCMQTCFEIQLVWNQVRLLDLLELVDQGGLGLWGDWGPLKFTPQHYGQN